MKIVSTIAIFTAILMTAAMFPRTSHAGALDQAYSLEGSGRLEEAAEFFCRYADRNSGDSSNAPEALMKCARLLDSLAETFSERAEKRCYWNNSGGDPSCMNADAQKLNARYGAGSFQYEHSLLFISYTGSHYRTLRDRYPRSQYAPEADFYLVLRDLKGHPDVVLPKAKAFMSRHPSGEWHRKALLLWARVNEDIWYVHRKWSWVIYNNKISQDELVVRAEPYRQDALKAFRELMKEPNTPEGIAASREYANLNANVEDPRVYSIVEDSSPGSLEEWGIKPPSARMTVDAPGSGGGSPPPPPSNYSPPSAPEERYVPSPPAETVKQAKPPQRWGE
jgi:hypothetical protein